MRVTNLITAVDLHACGEPGRVIIGGVLGVPGRTMFEKIVRIGEMVKAAAREQLPIAHPQNPSIQGITIAELNGPPTNRPRRSRSGEGKLLMCLEEEAWIVETSL